MWTASATSLLRLAQGRRRHADQQRLPEPLRGTIACEAWLSSPRSREEERLVRYFALDKESNRLLEMEHEVDNSREQAAVIAEIEAEFMDIVESEEWRMVDDGGRDLPILCPGFDVDGDLVWRWGAGRG